MTKKFSLVIPVCAVFILLVSGTAFARLDAEEKGRFGIEAILWYPEVTGEVAFDIDWIDGTELDIVDELNIDKTAMTFELGVWWNVTKRNRLSFFWFLDERSGSNEPEESVLIAGHRYVAGSEINTDITVQRYKLLYERAILRNDLGRLSLGAGFSYLEADAQVEGTALKGFFEVSDSTSEPLRILLPVTALSGEVHLPLGFGIFGEVCGMKLDYSYVSAAYFDLRAGVNWKRRFFFAQAGYKHLVLSGDAFDKLRVIYSLGGPFVSAGAKF